MILSKADKVLLFDFMSWLSKRIGRDDLQYLDLIRDYEQSRRKE